MRARVQKAPGKEYVEIVNEPRFRMASVYYFPQLLRVNVAWVVMLARQGVIPSSDALKIADAIHDLRRKGASELVYDPAKEEIFLHVETYVGDRVGREISGHIGMGRTRPEPITRMILREQMLGSLGELLGLRQSLVDIAEQHVDTVMPGYTHVQQAQPTTFAHFLMAVHDTFGRDFRRLSAAYQTVNRNTLGCGALSGTALPVDRAYLNEILGFSGMVENTMDCVSATDYLAEPMAALAILHATISRFASDICIWVSSEFALVAIDDEHAAISSMMPQKKNPAPVENVRTRSAIIVGNLMSVLGSAHSTPFQDVTDNYVDIGPVTWNSMKYSGDVMRLFASVIRGLTVDKDHALERVSQGFATTTALAETIAAHCSVSYRQAHTVVAKVVAELFAERKHAIDISAELVNRIGEKELGRPIDVKEEWIRKAVDPREFVKLHSLPGGPAPDTVRGMIADRRRQLEDDRKSLENERAQVEAVDGNLDRAIGELRG